MHYEASDFLETADSDTLKRIACTRELTREYYFSDYEDTEKRTAILHELLGGMGENVAIDMPFHCDCPFGISQYFKTIICADDTQEHKPNAAPLLKYIQLSRAECGKILYIGDSEYDSKCAENAGIDFVLAVWGSHNRHIRADYFLERPVDLLSFIT